MPIVLRARGYKFWFYEADLDEPPHIHVGKERKEAKFWLNPVSVARAGKFRPVDLSEIRRVIEENQSYLLSAWKREQSKRANS